MACISIRRNRYVLDWRDQWGRRKWLSFPQTPEGLASAEAERARIESGGAPGTDPKITLGRYITEHWIPAIRGRVTPQTFRGYEIAARVHIPETLKRAPLRSITRAALKRYLAGLGAEHELSGMSVAKVANVVRSIFSTALDDELIEGNPASGLRLALGLGRLERGKVRAMDGAQLDAFLAVAPVREPAVYPMFAVLAYAGLRIGELRGLQVEDVDLAGRTLRVERQVHDDGDVTLPKGRRPRLVDLAEPLAAILETFTANRRTYAMRTGSRSPWLLLPDWPVAPTFGTVSATTHRLRRAMARILKAARIPEHFTPHGLRHTFARLLLERGEDLLYVSRQLGHSGIAITADRYGHWARVRARAGGANLLSIERKP